MKRKSSGIVRALSLLLALVMVFTIPISAFAATTYSYDSERAAMMDHSAFRALKYLGYDKNEAMENAGTLFDTITSNVTDANRTSIPYNNNGNCSGLQTSTSNTGYLDVTSATGRYPNVSYFETGGSGGSSYAGLDCVDFAAYYLTNYLPNIEGADISALTYLMNSKYASRGYTYDNMDFWPAAREDLIDAGVQVWSVDIDDFSTRTDSSGNEWKTITRYTDPNGTVRTSDIYGELPIGTLIQMGTASDATVHYAIYAGTYNGKHYIYHCGNSRGPEISIVEYMWTYNSGSKQSLPLYFYYFPFSDTSEQYGSITVKKVDSNGTVLSGATFLVVNTATGEDWDITTGSNGLATLEDLPLGTYTITETQAPDGYVKSNQVLTVTLTAQHPDGGGTFTFTNTRAKGSIQVAKYNADASALLTGAVFCCVSAEDGSRVYIYDAASGSVTFTDPHNQQTVTARADGRADGLVTFTDLPTGLYRVYEANPPAGYVRDTTVVGVVLDTNGQTEYVKAPADGNYTDAYLNWEGWEYHLFKNTRAKGSIQVAKYNEDASALLTGAVFCCVSDEDGSRVYIYDAASGSVTFTDPHNQQTVTARADGKADGLVTFTDLPTGLYRIYEASPPAGYVRDATVVGVVVDGNGQTEYVKAPADGNYTDAYLNWEGWEYHLFKNTRAKGSIQIAKYNEDATGLLTGAVFCCVSDEDGTRLYICDAASGSVTFTDPHTHESVTAQADGSADGLVTFTDLPTGLYRVYEANPPAGYVRDATVVGVVVDGNGKTEYVKAPEDGNYTDAYLNWEGWKYHLFTNAEDVGSIRISKDITPDEAATPENLAGWQFNLYKNLPYADFILTASSRLIRVKLSDQYGNVAYSDAATISASPITRQPEDLFLANGSTGAFEVEAAGSGLTYQWQYRDDGTTWFNLPTSTNRLSITMTGEVQGRQYRCVITDADGNMYCSDAATVYLDTDLVITEQPQGAVCPVGEKATFTVKANGSNLSYAWYGSPDGGANWYYCAAGSSFKTSAMQESTAPYLIRCEITDGTNTITTEEVVWVRPDHTDTDGSYLGIIITQQPEGLTGTLNHDAQLTIEAAGKGLIYEWEVYDAAADTWSVYNAPLYNSPYITGGDGTVQIDNIPSGSYFIKEIDTGKSGWKYDLASKGVEVTANNTASTPIAVTFTNEYAPSGLIEIVKTTEDGLNLEGWLFGFYSDEACTNLIAGPYETDADGVITAASFEPGTVWVKELGHSDEEIDALYFCDGLNPQPVTVIGGETAEASFRNRLKRGSLLIQKDTNTSEDKGGWLVNVYRDSTAEENLLPGSPFETDGNGEILIEDLPIGTYIAVEVDEGKDLWICDVEEKEATVTYQGVAEITITNTHLGRGRIIKETTDGSSAAGWSFEIRGIDGNEIPGSPFTTGEDGTFDTGPLEPGEYLVYEIIPEGSLYQCVGENPKTLTVVAGETASVTFTNTLRPGSITVEKVNYEGENLAGAKFLLEWSENGTAWTAVTCNSGPYVIPGGCASEDLVDGCLITGEDGIAEFTGLHPSLMYRLTEVEAPNGYTLLADSAFTGTLPIEDLTVTLTVHNNKTYEMPASGSAGVDHGISITICAVVISALMILGFAVLKPVITDIPNKPKR